MLPRHLTCQPYILQIRQAVTTDPEAATSDPEPATSDPEAATGDPERATTIRKLQLDI